MGKSIDERIDNLLDQLTISSLTEKEIERIDKKIKILESHRE